VNKIESCVGKNVDLNRLCSRIENFLLENKFKVAYSNNESSNNLNRVIYAKKDRFLPSLFQKRMISVRITGNYYDFQLSLSSSKETKSSLEFSNIKEISHKEIPSKLNQLYSYKNFEDNLWEYMIDQINNLVDTHSFEEQHIVQEYSCDYIEGFPGWKKPILRGKLILENQSGNRCLIFNMDENKGVMIPPSKLIKVEIISKKTKISNPEQIVKMTFMDEKGRKHSPIFNFSHQDISGVFASINEVIIKSKKEKLLITSVS